MQQTSFLGFWKLLLISAPTAFLLSVLTTASLKGKNCNSACRLHHPCPTCNLQYRLTSIWSTNLCHTVSCQKDRASCHLIPALWSFGVPLFQPTCRFKAQSGIISIPGKATQLYDTMQAGVISISTVVDVCQAAVLHPCTHAQEALNFTCKIVRATSVLVGYWLATT